MSPLVPNGKAWNELSSERRTNYSLGERRKKTISALPSPVKSPDVILSVNALNWRAETSPELFCVHHWEYNENIYKNR